jgi:hypothetical protein
VHDVPTAVLLETAMALDMSTTITTKQSKSNNRLFLVPPMIFRYIAHDKEDLRYSCSAGFWKRYEHHEDCINGTTGQ